MRILDLLDDFTPEPHPDLIAAQDVTAADVMRAATGLVPHQPFLTASVPAGRA